MKRTIILGLACHTLAQALHINTIRWVEGVETLGPCKSPYGRHRAKHGKGQRKANRANRWG